MQEDVEEINDKSRDPQRSLPLQSGDHNLCVAVLQKAPGDRNQNLGWGVAHTVGYGSSGGQRWTSPEEQGTPRGGPSQGWRRGRAVEVAAVTVTKQWGVTGSILHSGGILALRLEIGQVEKKGAG